MSTGEDSNTVQDDTWPQPDFDGKIARDPLRRLDPGLMLISGTCNPAGHAVLETVLGPPETRDPLWTKMVELGVAYRKFRGFLNPEDFEKEERMRLNSDQHMAQHSEGHLSSIRSRSPI